MKIVLASKSPRRKQLLKKIIPNFRVVEPRVKEFDWKHKTPAQNTEWNACRKAKKIAEKFRDYLVIGADTIVILKGKILGKPRTLPEARRMLVSLSGKTHEVITGVCLCHADKNICVSFHEVTKVKMKKFSLYDIGLYVKKVHVLDKAGAYGIQEKPKIVEKIRGSYSNVVGLPIEPLAKLRKLFRSL